MCQNLYIKSVLGFVKKNAILSVLVCLGLFVPQVSNAFEIGSNYVVSPASELNAFELTFDTGYYLDRYPDYFEIAYGDLVFSRDVEVIFSNLEFYGFGGVVPDDIAFANCYNPYSSENYNLHVLDPSLNTIQSNTQLHFVCPEGFTVKIFNNSTNSYVNYALIISTETATTSDPTTLGDISFALAIIVMFMFLMFTGYMFNRVFKKKKW